MFTQKQNTAENAARTEHLMWWCWFPHVQRVLNDLYNRKMGNYTLYK